MMDIRARAERYAQAAHERTIAELSSTAAERNAALNRAAYGLGRFVGAGYLDRINVEAELYMAATANGYVQKDGAAAARATIRSGLSRGILHPRDIPDREFSGAVRFQPDPVEVERRRELRRRAGEVERADTERRKRLALRIWESGRDPRETVVERYLSGRTLDLFEDIAGSVIRAVERCPFGENGNTEFCMVSLQRDPLSSQPCGIHRTALTADGQKIGRKMLGTAGAIMLDPDEAITTGLVVGEGVESVLAARQLGLKPAWALGSTSGIANLPVLPGVEALTLLVERDENGASDRACTEAATRWHQAGRAVDFVRPTVGKDLNDVLRGGASTWC